jgi:cytochrome c-type biogenesis protein CcmH/NrfG
MIDQGRVDEAIAHARHVLRKFPKVIETYRLLGKAYLENDQNNDAADIFQRVLSAVPDDFVAHIGMSLIREEEGNLSSAVQHMERAFESQPYNNAIQEELKRLYGKRDGIEPPKVRLTQGALARMYLKGDLHQQGISELRSALAENPDRYDLKTLLAEAYAEGDQMAEAIDLSSDILKKFPYNLTANRILANTLKTHDHPQEMAICRKRLYALSPYEAYISEHAPTVDQVPDRAISLERLDWSEDQQSFPTRTREETTPWSESQAEGAEQDQETAVPEDLDWLDPSGSNEEDTIAEDTFNAQEEDQDSSRPDEEKKIPDWMEEAGWSETDSLSEEQEKGFQDLYAGEEESPAGEDDLAPADIPDWLLEQSPLADSEADSQPPENTSLPDEPAEADQAEPVRDHEPEPEQGPSSSKAPVPAEPEPEEIQPSDDDLPAWLKDLKSEEDDQETAIAWLKDMPENFLDPEDGPESEIQEGAEFEESPPSPAEDDTREDPDLGWLQGMMDEETEPEPSPEASSAELEDQMDFISPESVPEGPGDEQEQPSAAEEDRDEEDVPAWLKDLAAESSPQEEKPSPVDAEVAAGEEDLAEPPEEDAHQDTELDWSPGFELEGIPSDQELPQDLDDQGAAEAELPSWSEDEAPAVDENEDVPDWLSELEFDEGDEDDFELPELDDFAEPEPSSTEPEPEESLEPDPVETPEQAEAAELPDWLAELAGEEEEPEEETAPADFSLEEPSPPETAPEQPQAAPQASADDAADVHPEPAEPESDFTLDQADLGDLESDVEEAPSWLDQDESQPAPQDAPDLEEESEPAPQDAPDLEDESEPAPQDAPDLEDESDTMAWLESLAAKQGAEEEDFVTSPEERAQAQPPSTPESTETAAAEHESPQERPEDHLETQPEPEEPAPSAEITPAEEGDLPDWLAELQADQTEEIDREAQEDKPTTAEDLRSEVEEPEQALPDFAPDSDLDTQEGAAPEAEAVPADEEEMPDWLSAMDPDEDEEDFEQPPFADQEAEQAQEDQVPPDSAEPPEQEAEEEAKLDWLDTLAGEASLEAPEIESEPEAAQPAEPADDMFSEEESPEEDSDLPDWLSELENEQAEAFEVDEFEEQEEPDLEVEEPAFSLAPDEDQAVKGEPVSDGDQESAPEPEAAQDIGGSVPADQQLDEEETPIQEQAPPQEEPAEEEIPPGEPAVSGGMLDRLKAAETGELAGEEKIPEWIKDLKDEEDPQETAILWLKNYIEKGEEADLQQEIEHFTDNLRPHQKVPDWMDDLQKEEDPQTTAMLWLEKLEKEQAVQRAKDRAAGDQPASTTDELDDTDWLDQLEREQQVQEQQAEGDHLDMDERDWLSELEEAQPGQAAPEAAPESEAAEDQPEGEEETPPWMKATSPLEGDFLTGELESELQEEQTEEEEIPEWLAGYEDEEDLPAQQADQEPADAPEETEPTVSTPGEEYTWVAEDQEPEQPEQATPEKQTQPTSAPPEPPVEDQEQAAMASEPEAKPDLNTMGISDLESILGISFTTAQAIVSYRQERGAIGSYEELINEGIVSNQDVLNILKESSLISEPAETKDQPAPADETAPVFENKFQKRRYYAKKALDNGEIEKALEDYEILIDKKKQLEETVDDLTAASLEYPMNVQIIKTLGDAYMSMDQLQEALDAYSKAEDLLR